MSRSRTSRDKSARSHSCHPECLSKLEARFGRGDTSKGDERLVRDGKFSRLHCLLDLLRTLLLLALTLNADADGAVRLNNEDIEAALVIALTAQLADLGSRVAALHKVRDDALELFGRQTLEGQHRRQVPQRRRVVDRAAGATLPTRLDDVVPPAAAANFGNVDAQDLGQLRDQPRPWARNALFPPADGLLTYLQQTGQRPLAERQARPSALDELAELVHHYIVHL